MVRVLVLLFLFFHSFAFAELVPDSCYYNETSGEGFPDVNCYFRINGGWASPNPLLTSLYNDYCIGPAAGTWELRTNAGGKGWSGLRLVYHSSGCNFTVWYENAFYSADLVEVDDPNEDPDCTDCDIVFCPSKDDDGDGVYDQLSMGNICDYPDQCLNTPAGEEVDAAGCSATQRDTDGDGIKDAYDRCPADAGLPSADGCPDGDGDGVGDIFDLCPDTNQPLGGVDSNGCPSFLEISCSELPDGYYYSKMINSDGKYCSQYMNFDNGNTLLCGCVSDEDDPETMLDCDDVDSTWRNMGEVSGAEDMCNFSNGDTILTCSCGSNGTYQEPGCTELQKSQYYVGPNADVDGECIYFNGIFQVSCPCDTNSNSTDDNSTDDDSYDDNDSGSSSDTCPTCLGNMLSSLGQQIAKVRQSVDNQGRNLSSTALNNAIAKLPDLLVQAWDSQSFADSGMLDFSNVLPGVDIAIPETDNSTLDFDSIDYHSAVADLESENITGGTNHLIQLITDLGFLKNLSDSQITILSPECSFSFMIYSRNISLSFCDYAWFVDSLGMFVYFISCFIGIKYALIG